jgi:hypothetical protein
LFHADRYEEALVDRIEDSINAGDGSLAAGTKVSRKFNRDYSKHRISILFDDDIKLPHDSFITVRGG